MEKTKNMYKPHEDYLRDKESNRGFNSIIDGPRVVNTYF